MAAPKSHLSLVQTRYDWPRTKLSYANGPTSVSRSLEPLKRPRASVSTSPKTARRWFRPSWNSYIRGIMSTTPLTSKQLSDAACSMTKHLVQIMFVLAKITSPVAHRRWQIRDQTSTNVWFANIVRMTTNHWSR